MSDLLTRLTRAARLAADRAHRLAVPWAYCQGCGAMVSPGERSCPACSRFALAVHMAHATRKAASAVRYWGL